MPITTKQLNEILEIIRQASHSLSVITSGYEITPEQLQQLVADGWITADEAAAVHISLPPGYVPSKTPKKPPKESAETLIGTSFELGRLRAIDQQRAETMDFDAFKEYIKKNPVPLGRVEELAKDHAVKRAGEYCVALGNRYSGEVIGQKSIADEQVAKEFAQVIKDEVQEAIVKKESISKLTTNLRQKTEDWSRDWARIANTEMQLAYESGFLQKNKEEHGDAAMMAKVPEPGACKDCLRLYLDENKKPRIMPLSWWEAQGQSNYGRKRADWLPVTGAMHPWCRCSLIRVPKNAVFNDDWQLVHKRSLQSKGVQKSYKLQGRKKFLGMDISIENRTGSVRRWYDPHEKKSGETKMLFPYGYIRLTEGSDGDHIDCYVGPNENAKFVYIVHQLKAPDFKKFDEDKVMLGFDSRLAAKLAYLSHYDDKRFFGKMIAVEAKKFAKNVLDGKYRDGKKLKKAAEYKGSTGEMKPFHAIGKVGGGSMAVGGLMAVNEQLQQFKELRKPNHVGAVDFRKEKEKKHRKSTERAQKKLDALKAMAENFSYVSRGSKEFEVKKVQRDPVPARIQLAKQIKKVKRQQKTYSQKPLMEMTEL